MIILENYLQSYPIFNLSFSLILMFGLYYFGEIICYNKKFIFNFFNIKIKYQKILISL